jgi:hypothetical protein
MHPLLSNLQVLALDNCYVSWPPDWHSTQLIALALLEGAHTSPAIMASMPQLNYVTYVAHDERAERQGAAALLAVLLQLQELKALTLRCCDFRPDLDSAGSHLSTCAQQCAGLTASSKLETLIFMDCALPAGALGYMFPAGRQLQELHELEISWDDHLEHHNWWDNSATRNSASLVLSPGDLARLVAACSSLRRLATLRAGSGIPCEQLQGLLELPALTELCVAGNAWNNRATEQVLAHMTGEAGIAVMNDRLTLIMCWEPLQRLMMF